jgi:hypothetical protein
MMLKIDYGFDEPVVQAAIQRAGQPSNSIALLSATEPMRQIGVAGVLIDLIAWRLWRKADNGRQWAVCVVWLSMRCVLKCNSCWRCFVSSSAAAGCNQAGRRLQKVEYW